MASDADQKHGGHEGHPSMSSTLGFLRASTVRNSVDAQPSPAQAQQAQAKLTANNQSINQPAASTPGWWNACCERSQASIFSSAEERGVKGISSNDLLRNFSFKRTQACRSSSS